jgi:hypothetical protein
VKTDKNGFARVKRAGAGFMMVRRALRVDGRVMNRWAMCLCAWKVA